MTDPMTPARLAEIRARLEEAERDDNYGPLYVAAPADLRDLLAEVERLRRIAEGIRDEALRCAKVQGNADSERRTYGYNFIVDAARAALGEDRT